MINVEQQFNHVFYPSPRRVSDLQQVDLRKLATRLAEVTEGDDALVWDTPEETRVISYSTLKVCISADTAFTAKLVTAALEGDANDAKQLCIDEIEREAVEQIEEALTDYETMPEGYDLGDYL